MAPIRHDLFLCFGFWHAYSYAHVALWADFRSTFLAPAFFAIFPTQRLLRRPRLVQSSTFLTWIRFSYPHFRGELFDNLQTLRQKMLDFDRKLTDELATARSKKDNPFRHLYLHLLNLQTLLEFCIPIIQDYGLAQE